MEYPNCRICKCALTSDVVAVGLKGQNTLIAASERRGDGKFMSVSDEKIQLHAKCRAVYINEGCIHAAEKEKIQVHAKCEAVDINEGCNKQPTQQQQQQAAKNKKPRIRSSKNIITFDYQKQCLLCKEDASEDFIRNQVKKHVEDRIHVCRVSNEATGKTIIRTCFDGITNEHCQEVIQRVYDKDLVTLNARYHKLCYTRFLSHRIATYGKRGRPISKDIQEQMEHVFEYIDSNMDDSQFTIEELREAIDVDLPGDKTLKRKLIEHYGSNISVVETKGKPLVFCLISTEKLTLEDKWYTNKQNNDNMERMRIVCTAASIVLEDIRSLIYDTSYYPAPASSLENNDVPIPQTLRNFVEIIMTKYKRNPEESEKSVVAVCHSMMQAARPRSFKSPLLLSISSIIHQKYASRTLIDLLSSLGFCASYDEIDEVTKLTNSGSSQPPPEGGPAFKEFVFVVADGNMETIDGHA